MVLWWAFCNLTSSGSYRNYCSSLYLTDLLRHVRSWFGLIVEEICFLIKQNFNLKMHQTSIWRDQLFLISQLKLTKFDKLCTGIFIFELAPFKQLIFIQMLCHLAQCLKGCIFNGCCKCYLLGFTCIIIELWNGPLKWIPHTSKP